MSHVLLADDDTLVCEVVIDCLQYELRARVDCAQSGYDAAKLLKGYEYDLALIDAMLPGLDGFRLAEIAVNENTPALLMSGDPHTLDRLAEFHYPHLIKAFVADILIREATAIMQAAKNNIRRVQASAREMRIRTEALADVIEVSRRLKADVAARWLGERQGKRGT
jgi:DNA-binding response OmpR family regulator